MLLCDRFPAAAFPYFFQLQPYTTQRLLHMVLIPVEV
jgi:hypothetical protein